ncbi:hypothetical protein D1818_05575 [Aquimarina sp. BL5]|uniref:hypothetical protein n=1 Tax=Aquimarina sp. BL5 TaxID=1714860 RepID=UPI000E4ED159|nr:hypothetical protein [Aquimarina sp. BL5]AXT50324.1 hypothetical protein D1818_05575 [Aquimarina sp. BL5]RKM93067.1 hypothetical protein D7036_22470 [Aquimarina sp. BL5]
MNNLNKTYHKGNFRGGEWSKHLRPYLKRVGNKRWRKTGKGLSESEELPSLRGRKTLKKKIVIRITKKFYGDKEFTRIRKYRNIRDANNAMKRSDAVRAEIIKK